MEPIINSQLPKFKVQAFHNGEFKTISSEDVKGKWAIFFFYPADFTFVCPTELVDVAEKYEQFKAMGVEVYSVSTHSQNQIPDVGRPDRSIEPCLRGHDRGRRDGLSRNIRGKPRRKD